MLLALASITARPTSDIVAAAAAAAAAKKTRRKNKDGSVNSRTTSRPARHLEQTDGRRSPLDLVVVVENEVAPHLLVCRVSRLSSAESIDGDDGDTMKVSTTTTTEEDFISTVCFVCI
ncbi:unnamed protein product [Soboliphyme baturini]|uniref:Secreted protein n=1 Tax=Soboliphyme baturini TaxID=241478 RepID=A0A183J6I3_9BILA|nr:unnamed protein product [Soboliphyme baturini]